MGKRSIFGTIGKRLSSDVREQKEDYLTEILAWILKNSEQFASAFYDFITLHKLESVFDSQDKNRKKLRDVYANSSDKTLEIETQKRVDLSEINGKKSIGIIDMLIMHQNDGLIFEHKIDSMLSDGQLQKYFDCRKTQLGTGTFYVVLITRSRSQHTQHADVLLTWTDIWEFIQQELKRRDSSPVDFKTLFLLDQLSEYIFEEGMGMEEPIKMEEFSDLTNFAAFLKKIDQIFMQISKRTWKKDCPDLYQIKEGKAGIQAKYTSLGEIINKGRIGIDFSKPDWNPNIFAGLIIDSTANQFDHLDITRGPDVVLMVELWVDGRKKYVSFIQNPEFSFLQEKLTEKAANQKYNFDKNVEVSADNVRRVLVLRCSLMDLIERKESLLEQADAIYEWMVEGIHLLTTGDHLKRCREGTFKTIQTS